MRYIFLITLFLAPVSIASASEAETWKCKIHEAMGIIKGPDGLRPTRFVLEDHEYRILNMEALFDAVGRETVLEWMTESEENAYPLEYGHYFYRSTTMSGKDKWAWTAMFDMYKGEQFYAKHAMFNTKTARFETHPAVVFQGWTTNDERGDYSFEFAKCTRFFD